LSLFWRRMNQYGAGAGMVAGAVTVVVWKQLEGGIFDLYEILPGFLVCGLVIVAVSLLTREPKAGVVSDYDRTVAAGRTGIIPIAAE
jgi:sodium/proline symporter